MTEEIQAIPHNVGCEKSVLSTLLKEPHRADDVSLSESHFHLPGHKIVFRYIMAEVQGTKDVDPDGIDIMLMHSAMAEDGVINRVGGPSALADLLTYSPSPFHFVKHCEELVRFLAYRKTIEAADKMRDAAFQTSEISEVLSATSEPI